MGKLKSSKQKLKNKVRKVKAITLAGILAGSTALNSSCSTLLKTTLNSLEEGRNAISFVKKVYEKEDFNSEIIFLNKEEFDKKMEENQIKDLLLLIHGYGSSYKKFGEVNEEDSPLNIADKVFDGNVLLANYSSNRTVREIALSLLSELEKISLNYKNKFPRMHVLAHSMGGDVARYMVRLKPEYFKVVNFLASPLSGINFGKFNSSLIKTYPELLELEKGEFADNIVDLFQGSEMFKELNKPTEPLDVTYNFYAFLSKKNNPLIPGKDDGLVPVYSAYPYKEISEENFENVKIGNVLFFEGDTDHSSSVYNPSIIGSILYFSKSLDEKIDLRENLPRIDEISKIKILKAPLKELEHRKKYDKRFGIY